MNNETSARRHNSAAEWKAMLREVFGSRLAAITAGVWLTYALIRAWESL